MPPATFPGRGHPSYFGSYFSLAAMMRMMVRSSPSSTISTMPVWPSMSLVQ
uniref:PCQ3_66 n=1 Tax=Streptomyces sp. W9 TaxID=682410 RepID=D0UZB5_9ACTN|nr:pCQ3_66 [Streptomyces sp. W9]